MGRIQSNNKNLEDLTGAQFKRLPVSATTTVRNTAGKLLRVIVNTNGGTVTLRNGPEVIGVIAADAPEGTFNYGIYCNDSIVAETGATVDATVVFSR